MDGSSLPNLLVKDIINSDTRQWDLSTVDRIISDEVKKKIISIPIPVSESKSDSRVWTHGKNGKVSVKDAYNFLISRKVGMTNANTDWKYLWSIKCPQKIKFFLWKLCHNKLNLNESLYRKGISSSPGCSLCHSDFETVYHLFFNCSAVSSIWKKLYDMTGLRFDLDVMSPTFLKQILSLDGSVGNVRWGYIVPHVLWCIWNSRNKLVHEGERFVALKILALAIRNAREFYLTVIHKEERPKCIQQVLVKWQVPKAGYFKLNTDGASSNSRFAGIGGVVRNDAGDFVAGFAKHIYHNGSNVAEVWAARDGLLLAIQLGIRKLEVDCDSSYTIQLCKGEVVPPWYLRGLVQDIHDMKVKFEDLVFTHQYRETNFVADDLSKKAANGDLEGVWTNVPPAEIVNNIVADIQGVCYPRMIRV